MSDVSEILRRKGAEVVSVSPGATVLEATRVMNERHIGSVVVLGPGGVEGILTERDLLRRVLATERDPTRTTAAEVMTREVVCCTPRSSLDEVRRTFQSRRIRHLPVCGEDGALCGMVSMGDVNAYETESLAATVNSLEEYITRG